jgi:transmembrane sensor
MSDPGQNETNDRAIRTAAAQWTVRRDRGLSAAESIEFELWLAADARHGAAVARSANAWSLLDRAPESVAQRELARAAVRRRRRRNLLTLGTLAAAASLVVALTIWRPGLRQPVVGTPSPSALVATGPREVTLADGTLVRLNTGSEVREDFDAGERRVHLTRGEAHFTVVPNAARPFVVVAGTLRVRAVGTAFNVHLQSSHVEVLVTEGKVRLATETTSPAESIHAPLVQAGELATVATLRTEAPASPIVAPEIQVTRLNPGQIAQTLAWHLRLGGATLSDLALEFERRFGERILVADPAIGQLRAGGRVRADDADSFARLLATTFDLEVERGADGNRILRKKSSNPR